MSVSDWRSKAQKAACRPCPAKARCHRRHSERQIQLHGPQGDDLPAARRAVRPSAGLASDGAVGSRRWPQSPHRRRQHRRATMNAYAAKHDGPALIVPVPDQNGEATHNSPRADTTQGNTEPTSPQTCELGRAEDAARGQIGPGMWAWHLARRHLHHAVRPAPP